MEMYYVREYTPTCRFLKINNSTLTVLHYIIHFSDVTLLFERVSLVIFKNLQLECILHYRRVSLVIFKNLQLECILHYIMKLSIMIVDWFYRLD